MIIDDHEPCYVISVVARMIGVHAQTLRYYERMGLVEPSRSDGGVRLYSRIDIERLRQIKALIDDLGVNLAGVEVILRLNAKIADMERQVVELQQELRRLTGDDIQ
ncbi:MAG: helix-turn-helix transcriptional regulator [Chloroflexota bacterium]|nr:helix-turn-helix transcriptional regulator [Chloroflexota bacterium]